MAQAVPIRPDPRCPDLTGQRFGRLVVLGRAPRKCGYHSRWHCRCDCGKEITVYALTLRGDRYKTKSCGCVMRERLTVHGLHRTPEWQSWAHMRERCLSPGCRDYHNYGGRGITICARWLESFAAFLADVGPRPSPRHSIDRFPDNDGNYEPGNVRWATKKQQANNMRPNRLLAHDGKTLTLKQWSETTGIHHSTILMRLKAGWSIGRALTVPVRRRK